MSIKVMSYVWEHSKQKGSALLIELALADFANDEGECYPGTRRLAKKGRVSTVTLHKYLAEMESDKSIGIVRGRGVSTNGGFTSRYYLNGYRAAHGLKVIESCTHQADPVNTPLQRVVNPSLQPVVNTPLQPVVNPSLQNPSVEPLDKPSDITEATDAARGGQSNDTSTPEQPPAAKPRTPAQQANDALVESLGKAYGTLSVKGDYGRYLKIAQDLVKSGIPCGEFDLYVRRVKKIATEQHWKPDWTINALTGGNRMSEYVKARDAYAAAHKPDAVPPDEDGIYDVRLLLPLEMQPEHIRGKKFKEA